MSIEAFQHAVMIAAAFGLAVIVIVVLVSWLCKAAASYVDRCGRGGRIAQILALVATIAMILYGGTKPTPRLWVFEFVNGVHDAGSFCTNNLICAQWTYDTAAIEFTIKASYQDLTITNSVGECIDKMHELPFAMVRDGLHVWEVANATNMRVVVYSTYVPPPVVSTNGVYHLAGVMPAMEDPGKYVTPGVQIVVNLEGGEREVLTPTNKPPSAAILNTQEKGENHE